MLQLKNVSFFYNKGQSNEVQALSKINLVVKENEFISVLGPNGSGKSTLAHLLNALLKPHEGEVLVDNILTTSKEDIISVRKKVGLLFQNPDSQIVATIVEEDVAFGPENIGVKPQIIKKRIDDSLQAVDMLFYRNYEPHSLSVGQRQKVALASTLAMQPKYLVLDEPTSYLDPASRMEMLTLFQNINRKKNIAVINVTHNPEQVFYSKRVVVLDKGKIIFDGPVSKFFKDSKALEVTGFSRPLWLEIKEKYLNKVKGLEKVGSNKDLGNLLCSLN